MDTPWSIECRCLHTGTLAARSSTMHIDRRQMNSPGQWIIDALNTATLLIYIYVYIYIYIYIYIYMCVCVCDRSTFSWVAQVH